MKNYGFNYRLKACTNHTGLMIQIWFLPPL